MTAGGIQFMLYTIVRAASPQQRSGQDEEINNT